MSKSPRVIFKYKRTSEGDWQIEAPTPEPKFGTLRGLRAKLKLMSGRKEAMRLHSVPVAQ
jgi:hypothetical protein